MKHSDDVESYKLFGNETKEHLSMEVMYNKESNFRVFKSLNGSEYQKEFTG
jgi:hypothetical protein